MTGDEQLRIELLSDRLKPRTRRTAGGTTYQMAFRVWFGLTEAESGALVMLFERGGQPITAHDLAQALGISEGRVPVAVVKLRQALEAEAVDCVRGIGYALTEIGMGECRGALWTIGEELRKAS